MFTLLLAAWAMTRATEKGQFRLLALSLALVGVAFNIKMLEAFIVLPTFYPALPGGGAARLAQAPAAPGAGRRDRAGACRSPGRWRWT